MLGTAYISRIICARVVLSWYPKSHVKQKSSSAGFHAHHAPRVTAVAGMWLPALVWLLDLAEGYQGLGRAFQGVTLSYCPQNMPTNLAAVCATAHPNTYVKQSSPGRSLASCFCLSGAHGRWEQPRSMVKAAYGKSPRSVCIQCLSSLDVPLGVHPSVLQASVCPSDEAGDSGLALCRSHGVCLRGGRGGGLVTGGMCRSLTKPQGQRK